jgi:sulfur carrier protein
MLHRNNTDKCLATLYYLPIMQICVNGRTKTYEGPLAVAELLQRMELAGKKVAVERNGEIVPRGAHASTLLAEGDRLEIVVAVGGG